MKFTVPGGVPLAACTITQSTTGTPATAGFDDTFNAVCVGTMASTVSVRVLDVLCVKPGEPLKVA